MATVVISRNIISHVRTKITNMREENLREIEVREPKLDVGQLYEALFSQDVRDVLAKHSGFFVAGKGSTVILRCTKTADTAWMSVRFPFGLPENLLGIANKPGTGGGWYEPTTGRLEFDDTVPTVAEYFKWRAERDAYVNETRGQADAAERLLTNFRTLAPALKAWPVLWEFIPDDAKARHKEIATRASPHKAAGVAEQVEALTNTTVAVVAKKLAGE